MVAEAAAVGEEDSDVVAAEVGVVEAGAMAAHTSTSPFSVQILKPCDETAIFDYSPNE